ncbi:unnamed protein product, partial [Adineta steineri]
QTLTIDTTSDERNKNNGICALRNKLIDRDIKCYSLSDTITRDQDTSGYGSHDDPSSSNNRASSKVTFGSTITQNSASSSSII